MPMKSLRSLRSSLRSLRSQFFQKLSKCLSGHVSSDQMSQRSQVSRVAVCMSSSKVLGE